MAEKPGALPDIPVPNLSLQEQAHKIHFDVNHLGQRDRLAMIIGHPSPDRDSIAGLRFIYDSKLERSIGNTTTSDPQVIFLAVGAEVVRFSICALAYKLTCIEVCVIYFNQIPRYQ
jgi:hypothetical protein